MTNTTADIVGEDPRITHLEKTKQDTERELARVVDELAHVRETGAAELARASDDLVGAAVEIERQRQRADAAEQMVGELRGNVRALLHHIGSYSRDTDEAVDDAHAALIRTEAVAGRWVSKEEHRHIADKARAYGDIVHACTPALARAGHSLGSLPKDTIAACVDALAAERDAAIAARDEAVARLEEARKEQRFSWEVGAAAARARDEVGIQLAAAQAEIARMRPVVEAARDVRDEHMTDEPVMGRVMDRLIDALRALDAVPGDALAPRITAALEASGIDTDNMKGVE